MPNRILKESICTSEEINQLSWFEEVFFYRLIVHCDDYGRFDGRPAVLKSLLFPLSDKVTIKAVESAIHKLASVGLVCPYYSDKQYLYLPTWAKHQQVRSQKSKYPDPGDAVCNQMLSDDSKCPRNRNRESYSESESESESKTTRAREERFGDFWSVYPRKVAKQDAKKAWEKLKPSEELADAIIQGVLRLSTSDQWTRDGGTYIPYPATFLNGQRWNDELTQRKSSSIFLDVAQEMEANKVDSTGIF